MSTATKSYAAQTATSPLAPHTIERREPRASDVAIEILYCGVCHSDLHQARDEWHFSTFPVVPGHEIVGRVTAVGSAVTKFKQGDLAAVGCLVDSCRTCSSCARDLEQYCLNGATQTYNTPDKISGGSTYGGYSESIVVDEAFVLHVPTNLDLPAVAPLLCAGITTYSPLKHWGVKAGQKVLFRIVNASATSTHRIALAGHSLKVIALDGNPVATPRTVPAVELGPAERADCVVDMTSPGVWIMGETHDADRNAGLGIVIEYAGAQGAPRWLRMPDHDWDYTEFGTPQPPTPAPATTIPLQFKSVGAHDWTINGKSWPKADPIVVNAGGLYRLIFDNQSSMAHPVHLHRHTFELVKVAGKPTAGVFKDVVVVPGWKEVEVELLANNPGPSLFHCHHQFHMDQGFMALLKYA